MCYSRQRPLGMPEPIQDLLELPDVSLLIQLLADGLVKAVEDGIRGWALLCTWEPWMKLLAPSLACSRARCYGHLRNKLEEKAPSWRALSLSLSSIDFQMNEYIFF